MSNENEEPGLDFIHGSCEDKNIDGEDGDVGYYSQESSDTPPSPIDDTAPPFQDHSHFEQSQFEDEEPLDEFLYDNEYAIDDITKGIAFVLVHEKPAEKIGSAYIRRIVRAGTIVFQMAFILDLKGSIYPYTGRKNTVDFIKVTLIILFSKRSDTNDA